jgi:UDP-3-O-acyl-N-acetylglucosamine deacetylase
MKNSIKIYCENREQFYSFTNSNDVTKWTKEVSEARTFASEQEANNLITEFKNSAMNDTKYISII